MIEIKNMSDVECIPERYQETIRKFQRALEEDTQFDWERNGYMIFLEGKDAYITLPYMPQIFHDTSDVESISYFVREDLYELICVMNNEFVITYWMPSDMFNTYVLPNNTPSYVEVWLDTNGRLSS
jgi:hypothetical protein